ncbi:sulfotransferase family protein [Wenxinia marina]|uniref:Sulfotransferase family n=1 Tax=Wenxinia marina DSM 24838 TaxID=1123501 RepID=A0A0D0QEY2_9RHOB|nr:sulfotransferase family protein [Wenxinia marina]KIQ69548.1 hypothetical protein Wenmar_01912 [Wenxinia marina DSM 24838]GGL59243.1 sulfotransferase family protein [Wenxinia marina]
MTLQIIGAGWGRTGTETLRAALDALGFGPCHHMHEIRDRPELLADWQAFAAGAPVPWETLFRGYRSQVDFPGAAYWRELAAHYPDAKVILTVRDPDEWYDSVTRTVLDLLKERETMTDAHEVAVLDLSDRLIGEGYFAGRGADRDHMIARFRAHAAEVQAALPPERLLTYEVRDGWAPLCGFLGVPVPDLPFPHANDRDSYRAGWRG